MTVRRIFCDDPGLQRGQAAPFGGTPFRQSRFVQPWGVATDEARASTNETLFGCDVKTTYTTLCPVRQAFFRFFGEKQEKSSWAKAFFRGICIERGMGDSRIACVGRGTCPLRGKTTAGARPRPTAFKEGGP